MAEKPLTVVTQDQTSSKNGEENFNEEIKDYAKTTMNELLGMFGYDEEITRESVESLDIKVPTTTNSTSSSKATSVVSTPDIIVVTADMPSTPITITSVTAADTPSVDMPVDSSSDTPIIVKVEGNTSVIDIIRQQSIAMTSNNRGSVSQSPVQYTTAAQPTSVIQTASKSSAPATTQSIPGQQALAPHFYAVPPAVRGVYCVVANLPLVLNQTKSAMTFKFWNCITCSEYFLQKPEVVFRVQYPHLFNGQPEWLYQAAVCVKCHRTLTSTMAPRTTTIPANQAKATFKVIEMNDRGVEAGTVVTPSSAGGTIVITSHSDTDNEEDKSCQPQDDSASPDAVNHSSPLDEDVSEDAESTEENPDDLESYKCYVCSISVTKSSRKGKLRRSKFPSLFVDVPDNVGHFKVCHTCFDRLNRQRDRYIQANVHDEKRDYNAHIQVWTGAETGSKSCSTYKPNSCFVCERIVDEIRDPSRPIFRSRYPSLFRGLPEPVIHLPICDKCYKKLQKVKLRFDHSQQDEEQRDYIQFINMWRAKKGLGKHAVLV